MDNESGFPVNFDQEPPVTAYHLTVGDEVLHAVGVDDLAGKVGEAFGLRDQRIQELETKLDKLSVLIDAANCPQCRDKSGAYYDNNGEVSQCQWCYEVGCLDKTEDKE